MTIHEQHMKFVDAVNDATSDLASRYATGQLKGFRDGLRAAGISPDLIACDLTQFERGHENRPMCAGVFLDQKP